MSGDGDGLEADAARVEAECAAAPAAGGVGAGPVGAEFGGFPTQWVVVPASGQAVGSGEFGSDAQWVVVRVGFFVAQSVFGFDGVASLGIITGAGGARCDAGTAGGGADAVAEDVERVGGGQGVVAAFQGLAE